MGTLEPLTQRVSGPSSWGGLSCSLFSLFFKHLGCSQWWEPRLWKDSNRACEPRSRTYQQGIIQPTCVTGTVWFCNLLLHILVKAWGPLKDVINDWLQKKMRGVLVTWCPCHGTGVQEPSCGGSTCFAPLSTGLSCRLRARWLKHWLLPPFSLSASWHPGASQTQPQCASSSGPFSSHSLKLDQSMTLPTTSPLFHHCLLTFYLSFKALLPWSGLNPLANRYNNPSVFDIRLHGTVVSFSSLPPFCFMVINAFILFVQ